MSGSTKITVRRGQISVPFPVDVINCGACGMSFVLFAYLDCVDEDTLERHISTMPQESVHCCPYCGKKTKDWVRKD